MDGWIMYCICCGLAMDRSTAKINCLYGTNKVICNLSVKDSGVIEPPN